MARSSLRYGNADVTTNTHTHHLFENRHPIYGNVDGVFVQAVPNTYAPVHRRIMTTLYRLVHGSVSINIQHQFSFKNFSKNSVHFRCSEYVIWLFLRLLHSSISLFSSIHIGACTSRLICIHTHISIDYVILCL